MLIPEAQILVLMRQLLQSNLHARVFVQVVGAGVNDLDTVIFIDQILINIHLVVGAAIARNVSFEVQLRCHGVLCIFLSHVGLGLGVAEVGGEARLLRSDPASSHLQRHPCRQFFAHSFKAWWTIIHLLQAIFAELEPRYGALGHHGLLRLN